MNNLFGEYFLTGVHEMAAGFLFEPDFSFKFFYSYGASDRHANGRFNVTDNQLVLNGSKIPGNDFNLEKAQKHGKGFTIKIIHPNKLFVQNVVCTFYGNEGTITEETDADGIASVKLTTCSRIELIHAYFPDVPSVFELPTDGTNYFEFGLNLSLEEVVFQDFTLNVVDNGFEFTNIYLFGNNKARFVKKM